MLGVTKRSSGNNAWWRPGPCSHASGPAAGAEHIWPPTACGAHLDIRFLTRPSVWDWLALTPAARAGMVRGGFHSTKHLGPCGEPSSPTVLISGTPAAGHGVLKLEGPESTPCSAAAEIYGSMQLGVDMQRGCPEQ